MCILLLSGYIILFYVEDELLHLFYTYNAISNSVFNAPDINIGQYHINVFVIYSNKNWLATKTVPYLSQISQI